ncbi:hypothetical protein E2I00_013222, partial [Balaenoptera physalus]
IEAQAWLCPQVIDAISQADVVEGALNAARAAHRLIDMSRHRGEHPRMGALDVCPFVPVRGVTVDECALCAQAFGQRLAEELGVPVYLYGEAARTASRQSLPAIRAGEYEALPEKVRCPLPGGGLGVGPPPPFPHPLVSPQLKQAEWAPDFGPSSFVPSWGATVTGARKFLIACLRYFQVPPGALIHQVTGLHTVYEETCREAQPVSRTFLCLLRQKATKLPKNTPEDKDRRAAALQEGLKRAVAVPLALAEMVTSLWPALQELALCVAVKALETGVFGAYFNVLINLKDVTDDAFKDQ